MTYTTNPSDPRLRRGADQEPRQQHEAYLVLSEEERARGFVRPLRFAYVHVGEGPRFALRELTADEQQRHAASGYVAFEAYPESESPVTGRFWTQEQLDRKGCGTKTTMGRPLAETYARDPRFYGSTYCAGCSMHRPVAEFVWDGTDQRVGS